MVLYVSQMAGKFKLAKPLPCRLLLQAHKAILQARKAIL